ncbi:unnamed protein product [Meganyctiphanes norvegica]|uniref:Uncharacterized protein n=1 Tax=Meganyctiphanes norvegica TaxID=48144 RepID=A0AAV2Q8D7_MEGNR
MNEELQKRIEELSASLKPKDDDLINETWNINFWEYAHVNPVLIEWFYINMDTSRDRRTGWPMFVEMLGLERAHIEHCELYPGSVGPTQKAFQYLKGMEDKMDLKLGLVLEILKDLNRHDLLNPSFILWKEGIKNYKKLYSGFSQIEPKDIRKKYVSINNKHPEFISPQPIGLVKGHDIKLM